MCKCLAVIVFLLIGLACNNTGDQMYANIAFMFSVALMAITLDDIIPKIISKKK